MRFLRMLCVAVCVTAGCLAFAATAGAMDEVEVIGEYPEGSEPCPAVSLTGGFGVDGGCHLSMYSDEPVLIDFWHPWTGAIDLSTCSMAGELYVDGTGEGWLTDQLFLGGLECDSPEACVPPEEAHPGNPAGPWHTVMGEVAENELGMTINMCLLVPGWGECEGEFAIDLEPVDSTGTQYVATTGGPATIGVPDPLFGNCRITGTWLLEPAGEDDLEAFHVNHVD